MSRDRRRDEALTDALHELQASHASLAYSRRQGIEVYAPGVPIPERLRQVIRAQLPAVLALLSIADVRTCCAPGYHRPSWRYAGDGRYVCGRCEQLAAA